jgi:hypothetical protein
MKHFSPAQFYKYIRNLTIWKPRILTNHKTNVYVRTGVVQSYIGVSVFMGQVGVAILNDQPSSQFLHLQTVQRSMRILTLRALSADKMHRFGSSASHVANVCGG